MKKQILQCGVIILGALLLMIFAFYDNYPVVTNDTGSYILSGMTLTVPDDRPVFYGLFLRATSLGFSLWLSVFCQCLILSWVLIKFIRSRIPFIPGLHVLGIVLLTSVATIGGWYASQLMPDIFTSILCLALLNYLLNKNSKKDALLLLLISFAAMLMHNSHYLILTAFILVISAVGLISKTVRIEKRKIIALSILCMGGWLLLCTSNFIGKKGFRTSNATHVFLMGKLAESGILKEYLDRSCQTQNYSLCMYKDSLSPVAWGFVWDAGSPLYKTGGWEQNRDEYRHIIRDIVSTPRYWPLLLFKSIESTARQLTFINIDESCFLPWVKYDAGTPPYENIRQFFPHELNELEASRQNTKTLNLPFYSVTFALVLILSSLTVMFSIRGGVKQVAVPIYIFLFLFLILNAFTTAMFANVLTRLNSRVIWLLPMFNMVFIYRMLQDFYLNHEKERL